MRAPTLAPSPFGIHRARTRKLVAAVFAVGLALFGYGTAATVLELLPAGWGAVAAMPYVVMAVGVLLASLMALVAAWFSRQEEPRPLPRRAVLAAGLVAPLVSTGVMVVAYWWQVGEPTLRLQRFEWLLLGQAVLGLQLFVGSLEPVRRRRRLLVAQAVAVFLFTVSILVVDGGAVDLQSLDSALFVGGAAVGLFVLVGGPLYLLGNVLVCRPRYHRIP